MNRKSLERIISTERLNPYLDRHNGNFDDAIMHYRSNIKISEAFYPLISVLEIGLRNNMDQQLIRKFKAKYWFDSKEFKSLKSSFLVDRINDAKRTLKKSRKEVTSGRVISELTFGFWTAMFDKRFEKDLWKDLRLVFPNCPKKIRQRKTISAKLNNIRKISK